MNNVYDFESFTPPVVSEAMLYAELKRRELKRQIIVLYIAAMLMSACIAMMALITAEKMILVSLCLVALFFVWVLGFSVIGAFFFIRRSKNLEFFV